MRSDRFEPLDEVLEALRGQRCQCLGDAQEHRPCGGGEITVAVDGPEQVRDAGWTRARTAYKTRHSLVTEPMPESRRKRNSRPASSPSRCGLPPSPHRAACPDRLGTASRSWWRSARARRGMDLAAHRDRHVEDAARRAGLRHARGAELRPRRAAVRAVARRREQAQPDLSLRALVDGGSGGARHSGAGLCHLRRAPAKCRRAGENPVVAIERASGVCGTCRGGAHQSPQGAAVRRRAGRPADRGRLRRQNRRDAHCHEPVPFRQLDPESAASGVAGESGRGAQSRARQGDRGGSHGRPAGAFVPVRGQLRAVA